MLAETQRLRMLQAMGIDVYVPRPRRGEAPLPAGVVTPAVDAAATPRLVIVCEPGAATGAQQALLRALGLAAGEIDWLHVLDGALEREPPALQAWLVLGEPLARVLGGRLTTQQQNASVIAVAPALVHALRDGAARRAFWQALKPLVRALRTGAMASATHH